MGFGEFNHCIDILMQSLSEASLQCLTASQSGYNTKAAADMAFSY